MFESRAPFLKRPLSVNFLCHSSNAGPCSSRYCVATCTASCAKELNLIEAVGFFARLSKIRYLFLLSGFSFSVQATSDSSPARAHLTTTLSGNSPLKNLRLSSLYQCFSDLSLV